MANLGRVDHVLEVIPVSDTKAEKAAMEELKRESVAVAEGATETDELTTV